MAARKPLFMGTEGFSEEMATSDEMTLGALTMGGNIAMGANKITGLGDGTADGDALGYQQTGAELGDLTITAAGDITLSGGGEVTGLPNPPTGSSNAASKAYVDGLVTGLGWKEGVVTRGLVGNATCATINGLSPAAGDSYVVLDASTITSGSISTAIGDLVEYSGSVWVRLVQGSGGYVPVGTRVILSEQETLISPYTDATDNDKIVEFSGSSNTGADSGDAVDKAAVLIQDDAHVGYYDNEGYTYEGTVPSGSWIQFTGTGNISAGTGLTKTGNTIDAIGGDGIVANANDLAVDITADIGLHFNSGKLEIELDNTPDTLDADSSGLKVVGLPSLFKINDVAVGASVTAAKLDSVTDGGNADTEHVHGSSGITLGHGDLTGVTSDQHHAQLHSIASHNDTTATGAELETLTDGSNADSLHVHADAGITIAHSDTTGQTSDDHHAQLHTVASHSDTTATGAELETLTDGSNADALHVHASAVATEAPKIENTLTTATDATSDGDPVYFNGNDTIGKARADTDAKARVIGVIRTGSGAAGATPDVVSLGECAGVLTGATFNTPYYLGATGGISTSLPAAGNRVVRMGVAVSADDLWVGIVDYGKKAA
jgi:hypothetical protein